MLAKEKDVAKLIARLDSLDDIEESARGFYREASPQEGGGYVIDVAPSAGWALENVSALKNAYSAEQEKRRVASEEVDTLRTHLERAEAKAERLGKRKHDEPDTQKAIEEAVLAERETWNAKFEDQGKSLGSRIEARDREVYGFAVENQALASLKRAGATDEGLDLLMPHVQKRLRMRRDNEDKLHVDVLDGNGNPAVGSTPNEPATLEHIITSDFKSKYPSAFKGTEQSGSGAPGDRRPMAGAPGRVTPEQVASMSPAEYRKARSEGRIGA